MSIPPITAFHVDVNGGDVMIDDQRQLAVYDALLSDDGHTVRTALTGAEALRMVDEREPELILLDVSSRGSSGASPPGAA